MEEKILNARKNGMAVLLLTLLGYAASIACSFAASCCWRTTGCCRASRC